MAYVPRQEEKELVDKCLRGDQQAQKKLFELYYGKMLAICQRYTKDREEAKDIHQEGFVKVYQKLSQFNFSPPRDGWIRRIMVNTSINNYRRNVAEPVTYDIDVAQEIVEEN